MGKTRRIAAIDIGTVTTRLLVADVNEQGLREVERSTDITHLGENLTQTGRLSESAMATVADVIAGYSRTMARLGVERSVAIATSASRDASNADRFIELLSASGVTPEVIPGRREAALAFLGATAEREGEGLLVVDCGGGSTELIVGSVSKSGEGRVAEVAAARSIDVGSRRMTEKYLLGDPPTAAELDRARAWASGEIRPFFERLDTRPRQLIGVAGTATTLAAIHQELVEYDSAAVHGYVLSGSDLSDMLEMLAALPLERRKQVVGLHPQRASVIVAGALIFETVLALAGVDSMLVSEHDILYGILLDAYRELQQPANSQ
jgi:exopolyphosphatase/guanosine-5'-triphosphate,3'-diphosphate pyrophosphatase